MIVFTDDILIYSRSEDENVYHFRTVLQIFKVHLGLWEKWCMSDENDVYDDRVIFYESINVILKVFLTYEYDHDCEWYFSHMDSHWWKVFTPMLLLCFKELFYVLILKMWIGINRCLSYVIMIFDFYLFHLDLDLAARRPK